MLTRFSGFSFSRRLVRRNSKSILVLIAASGSAAIFLVAMAAIWAGGESDIAALERQKQLVSSRLNDQVSSVANDMRLLAAAYTSLLREGHEIRAAGLARSDPMLTFGEVATPAFGYEKLFLIDAGANLAMTDDQATLRRFRWVRPLLLDMLERLKTRQLASDAEGPRDDPAQAELMRLEGRPSIVGAVPISGYPEDTGSTAQEGDKGQLYLVAFRFLDGAALDALSREQGLNGARYSRTVDAEDAEVAFEIEATSAREPIGFIIWTPDLPGSRVIERLTPALSIGAAVLAALFFALIFRLSRSWTALKQSEQNARHLSLHDALTTLPNRAMFGTCLDEAHRALVDSGTITVVAFIDLDRFKAVNDSFGHAVGDELILRASERMHNVVGPDGMLARLGGDEFALLLPGAEDDLSLHIGLCDTIVHELQRPFDLRSGDVTAQIGCSIGVATVSDRSQTPRETLRQADVALYHAKASGRGCCVVYDAAIEAERLARDRLTDELRAELARISYARNGAGGLSDARTAFTSQLEVFYQTVHRAAGRYEVSGAEALVRWRHPEHGLLTPDRFVPLAEESGLIDQLGRFVLEEACTVGRTCFARGVMAVNVSPKQLRRPGFADEILSVLKLTGLAPAQLELELTETALLENAAEARASLSRLRNEGIKIALDDFGTGYSSLSHLIQFGIDRIKIDRSFVRLLDTESNGAAIAAAITALGRNLGIATTAEGVETEAQRDFLTAIGCSDLQGYLFSRPVPATDIASHRLAVQSS